MARPLAGVVQGPRLGKALPIQAHVSWAVAVRDAHQAQARLRRAGERLAPQRRDVQGARQGCPARRIATNGPVVLSGRGRAAVLAAWQRCHVVLRQPAVDRVDARAVAPRTRSAGATVVTVARTGFISAAAGGLHRARMLGPVSRFASWTGREPE